MSRGQWKGVESVNEVNPYGMPVEPPRSQVGARLRLFVSIVSVAFVVTLAVMVGQRLSDQAMAVLAGTVCGVGASIPTSLLIVWVTRRRQEQQAARPLPSAYPPVVVVQPPAQTSVAGPQQTGGYLSPYLPPAQREFTVVGGAVEEVQRGYRQ